MYKNGGQKKNVKCLCKNGQNGDPAWKKSCSWSFKDAPWSASDVKTIQCKARTDQSTTTATTSTTTTTTTTTPANPNTHRFCKEKNTWIPCSNCYSYVETDDYFYNYDNYNVYRDEWHTCTYSISTKCNPNFVDRMGRDCDYNEFVCGLTRVVEGVVTVDSNMPFLDRGIMTDEGYMTAFNCPQCGCTEENGPIRPNFDPGF